ncbi:ultraviolet-B receptor UVR8 isoform X1 [Ipomoea triloba]|uniref:ultraviolet-B receptor UVR8 isoform X1 n=1 Tax=Ipomoea triloba TaxID=35885 RepID=UPI00125D67ED|nr:ultraviolet-B receptor UVR8 isoform X1 [Ipomoea triloba]
MEENERFEEKQEEEEEEIWSWGAGTEGQLGTGMLSDEHCPQLLHSLSSFAPISLLACGGAHVVALTSGGRVVTWGRGTSGQLGHGEAVNNLQPKAIEALGGFVITHVSAGWNHSGFVSDNGHLFTCGDGTFGQLGLGDYLSRSSPVEVSYLSAENVKQIACGMRHSLALIKGESGDRVFGFGSGKRGQLGISDDKVKSVAIPQVTLGLENLKINAIIANGDHSAAICADGHLYTWGRSFGSDSDMYTPRCVTVRSSFCSAALGWNHALALTGDGEVFMIGGYKIKQTSEDAGKGEIVKKIDSLDGIKVLQISAGAEHSALVTVYRLTYVDDGSVMTWGWGEHGQLGFGDTNDEAGPRVVSLSHEHAKKPSIAKVYCGSGFTFVVKKHAG